MSPESRLDFAPGIWAPKCARIPAQKNQGNWSHPFQKAGRLLLHVRPANLTPSTALLMLGPSPGCWYRGCIRKPSSQLQAASYNVEEALVSSISKTAAPAHTVTALHRQKRVPYSGSDSKTVFAHAFLLGCGAPTDWHKFLFEFESRNFTAAGFPYACSSYITSDGCSFPPPSPLIQR